MRGVTRTILLTLAVAIAAAGAAGCGLGPGRSTANANAGVIVTQSFGTGALGTATEPKVPGSETVMRMLQRSFKVSTRYGGGFVQSIDGHAGDSSQRDWFYYVNGIQAPAGAATTAVHPGDRIWWDLHDWAATDSVPAVVGSFPEPFIHGVGGRRLPTVLECATDVQAACTKASSELNTIGVPVASGLLGSGAGTDSLAIVVGTWPELTGQLAAELVDHGPKSSGIYAKFVDEGTRLQLLDPQGRVVRTLGAGAGLVAATSQSGSEPVWMITGTDASGVAAAASAFNVQRLKNHFALAVSGGQDVPVPLQGAS